MLSRNVDVSSILINEELKRQGIKKYYINNKTVDIEQNIVSLSINPNNMGIFQDFTIRASILTAQFLSVEMDITNLLRSPDLHIRIEHSNILDNSMYLEPQLVTGAGLYKSLNQKRIMTKLSNKVTFKLPQWSEIMLRTDIPYSFDELRKFNCTKIKHVKYDGIDYLSLIV